MNTTDPVDLEALRGHTPGPWFIPSVMGSSGGVAHANGYVCFTAIPRKVDEARQLGESWLDMRDRTKQEREAIAAEESINARLIAITPMLLAEYERLTAELTARRARDADVEALVAALREAMEWNWLDEDAPPSTVADQCEKALAPFTGDKT